MQIPINFVTQPGISLTAACFGHRVYQDDAARKCISNILAVGYRRLVVDLYWSAAQQEWSLCPVDIPRDLTDQEPTTSSPISSADPATLHTGNLGDIGSTSTQTTESTTGLSRRDLLENVYVTESQVSFGPTSLTTPEPTPLISSITANHGSPKVARADLHRIGPYTCTGSLDLSALILVLQSYCEQTEDTLNAQMLYLIFNIHSALAADDVEQPPQAPPLDRLPNPPELLGAKFGHGLGTYLYTPTELNDDRNNLNASWYSTAPEYHPISEYITMQDDPNYIKSTRDGWPPESYLELVQGKRLLLAWGTVDSQMEGYNFAEDSKSIFNSGSLTSHVDVSVSDGDEIESGCLYNSKSPGIQRASWAQSEIYSVDSASQLANLSDAMAICGVSPLVNTTLFNVTADQDMAPYRNVSLSIAWSWADGEPRNSSFSDGTDTSSFRCAVMDTSLHGHWRADDCSKKFHAACRVGNELFRWVLSGEKVSYRDAQDSCPDNSSFSVPRTGLENIYLYKNLIAQDIDIINVTSDDADKRNVWIDFNTIDVPTCWVTHGRNAQCPYEVDQSAVERRVVLVPTIAAIIILIITALTLFVKCNTNRRNSRRRRVINGWEYEGVPS